MKSREWKMGEGNAKWGMENGQWERGMTGRQNAIAKPNAGRGIATMGAGRQR
jgi:hypothetical protein